jgi:putative ABC transport system permease protein
VPLIRERIRAINSEVPVYMTGSMADFIDSSVDNRKSLLTLLGIFAGIALALSAVGIYSVLAYDISQRTREIGIRGAIGAAPRQILSLVLRQGLQTIGIGIGVGLIGALFLGQLMASRLFEIAPYDPTTLEAISLLLLSTGIAASLLPVWRAARIDPVVALRTE